MAESDDVYRRHSRWSDPRAHAAWLTGIPPAPDAVARHVGQLVVHCLDARMRGIPVRADALRDVEMRSVPEIVRRIRARDARPATAARDPESSFFGVCAHYALLSTAVLRAHGVAARVRVGFASYFVPGSFEDHWVTEYRDAAGWRLLDAQLDDRMRATLGIEFPAWDVPREVFLDASTAWCRLRAGTLDATRVGVTAVGLAGAWFAGQSVLRDVAALDRDEMLPWDTWGRGREIGPHARDVPADLASGIDTVARQLAGSPDAERAARVRREAAWLRRTRSIFTLAFPRGWPDGVPTETVLEDVV